MLTSGQIRAARALLRWSAQRLADETGISWRTIARMESVDGVPSANSRNLLNIQQTLEKAGIEFIEENGGGAGIRLKRKISE